MPKRKPKSKARAERERRARRWKPSQPSTEIRTRRQWSTSRKVIVAAVAFLVILMLGVAIDVVRIYSGIDRVEFSVTDRDSQSTNFLFIGSDSRASVRTIADLEQFGSPDAQSGERADIMILLHVPKSGNAVLVGIPRDLLIEVPGEGDQRLTLVYDQGAQKLADVLCTSLGVGVDHFVAIDFKGLERLVDSIGGIDVDIDTSIRSIETGLDLGGGEQQIDGSTALKLVRTRTGEQKIFGVWTPIDDGADLRMRNSVLVLRGIASKVRSVEAPWDLRRLADSVGGHVRVDSRMGLGTMFELNEVVGKSLQGEVTRIPARTIEGETPVAVLGADAARILQAIGAGDVRTCVAS